MKYFLRLALRFLLLAGLSACMTKGSQTGAGVGLTPLANPPPGGMAGPEAAGAPAAMGGGGEGPAGAAGDQDPAGGEGEAGEGTFSDAPIAVIGAPKALTDKKRPCDETGFTLCFSGVTISDVGPDPEADPGTGRRQYRIVGCLFKKIDESGLLFDLTKRRIDLQDLLFPESSTNPTRTNESDCFFRQPTFVSGRPNPAPRVRLQATYCKRTTTLDVPLPDPNASPLTFDPCSSPGPTDVYTGKGEATTAPFQDTPGTRTMDPSRTPDTPQTTPEPDPQESLDHLDFLPGRQRPTREIHSP